MDYEDRIEDILYSMSEYDFVDVWNEYCDNNRYDEDRIYYMSDFWDIFAEGMTPEELIQIGRDGFDTTCDYFQYGIYGPEAFDNPFDQVYMSDLVNYIVQTNEDFGDDEIREILDAMTGETDEDDEEETEEVEEQEEE